MQVYKQACVYEGAVHETLSKALLYCASDTRCVGIKDYVCDNKNDFYVCLDGIKTDYDDDSGCIYKKSENYGKLHYNTCYT